MGRKILFVLLSLAIITFIGIIFSYFSSGKTQQIKTTHLQQSSNCTPSFTHHFTDPSTIISIVPPVFRNSRGTMPTMLINITGKAPLYMPADGKAIEGSYHVEEGTEFYMWYVDVGCGVTVTFDHVTDPVEKIKNLFPKTPNNHSRTTPFEKALDLKAGDLVGYTTGSTNAHNWNFSVHDISEKNYLYDNPEFKNLPRYYSQVCPFKYYDESISDVYKKLFIFNFNDITVEKNLCQD